MPSHSIYIVACSVILAIGLQSGSTYAFTGSNFAVRPASIVASSPSSTRTSIFSTPTPENEGDSQQQQLDAFVDPLSANKPSAPAATEEANYPIDLPSPILLASSMILAIIGVGKRKRNDTTCGIIRG
uniref:PEP-CTERM protein-sorting domain-containing protein n=1 Tax=Pseudo-nitzschia australis TaxID=44445 RepID=A0A7S4AKE2_9STRA